MTKHNPSNERIKREYFIYLKAANGRNEATVDAAAAALRRFEEYTKFRDFKQFHTNQAIAFKNQLSEQKAQRSGETLSKATLHSILASLKKFFFWLAGQPGYKSRLKYSDADYFNISTKDARIATAQREQKFPTLEQIKHVISVMPVGTEIERRDRALVAFTLLTGARDSAIASMMLKHVDLEAGKVFQDARDVKTKNSKTITTFFFSVGDEIRAIVTEWVQFLRNERLWGNNDPLFPATRIIVGQTRHFEADGLERKHWSTATPIRQIFRKAFSCAGLPYFNPHSFRNTIVQLGERRCQTPEEFKSWSQNLGHEKVLTTLTSYGEVSIARQGELIRGLGPSQAGSPAGVSDLAKALAQEMKRLDGQS